MNHRIWTLLPAAGQGSRMGGAVPKQYLEVDHRCLLELTLDRICEHPAMQAIVLILAQDDRRGEAIASRYPQVKTTTGGRERADSVLAGLEFLRGQAQPEDWVLVHDVARPCFRMEDIDRLLNALRESKVGGLLGAPVSDTLKRVDRSGRVQATVSRSGIFRAFTPQMFRFRILHEAIQAALQAGLEVTDEASALERTGVQPLLVQGHDDNLKVTWPQDLERVRRWLADQRQATANGGTET